MICVNFTVSQCILSIAVFKCAPVKMTGVIGALFNSGLELGSAVGIAVSASIETSIEDQESDGQGFFHYKGRRAAFWWLFACNAAPAVAIAEVAWAGRRADAADGRDTSCQFLRLARLGAERCRRWARRRLACPIEIQC